MSKQNYKNCKKLKRIIKIKLWKINIHDINPYLCLQLNYSPLLRVPVTILGAIISAMSSQKSNLLA